MEPRRIRCRTPECPNSIVAPPDADADTTYTCAYCTALGIAEGARLDRSQHDDFKIRPDRSEFPQSLLKAASKAAWVVAKADIEVLSDQQQIIFFMRYWIGLTPSEISRYLRVKPQTVKNKLQQIKGLLGYSRGTHRH